MKEYDIKLLVLIAWLLFSIYMAISNLFFSRKNAEKSIEKYKEITKESSPAEKSFLDFFNKPLDELDSQVRYLKFMGVIGVIMSLMAILFIINFINE